MKSTNFSTMLTHPQTQILWDFLGMKERARLNNERILQIGFVCMSYVIVQHVHASTPITFEWFGDLKSRSGYYGVVFSCMRSGSVRD